MGKMVLVITILSLLSISVLSEDKSTVAVLDLQVLGGLSSSEALILSEKVREALFLTGKFKVLDRSTMDEILKEQGFSQSGCTSDECIVQVGRMLSAQKMVAGSVGKIGGTYTLSLKLVDVQTGEIDNMASYDCEGCMLDVVAVSSTKEVVGKLMKISNKSETDTVDIGLKGPLTGMEFVLIPAGSFVMGSPENERLRKKNEGPQHKVDLKQFCIMTTEVTQKMWVEVMGSNPREYKGDNFPVIASWEGAQSFIRKLNRLDPGKGYRLPAEAEWEYACRAGTTTRYYWGDDPKNSAIGNNCWTYGSETHEVGLKAPNDWGLYDMSGSVWEWCEDYYHKNYNGAPMDGSAWISPEETYRVLRGGSYHTLWSDCRSARRYYDYPSSGNKNCIGFRLVRNY